MFKANLQEGRFIRAIYLYFGVWIALSVFIFVTEKYLLNHALLYWVRDYFGENHTVFGRIIYFPAKFFSMFFLVRFIVLEISHKTQKASLYSLWITLFLKGTTAILLLIGDLLLSVSQGSLWNYMIISTNLLLSWAFLPVMILVIWLKREDVAEKTFHVCLKKYMRFFSSQWARILLLGLIAIVFSVIGSIFLTQILSLSVSNLNSLSLEQRVVVSFYTGMIFNLLACASFVMPFTLSKLLRDFVDFLKSMKQPKRK